jgi:hypothetical protein
MRLAERTIDGITIAVATVAAIGTLSRHPYVAFMAAGFGLGFSVRGIVQRWWLKRVLAGKENGSNTGKSREGSNGVV